MAATLPVASLPAIAFAGKNSVNVGGVKPSPAGRKRNLLFVSDIPENYGKLVASIKAIDEFDINVEQMKADFKKPQEILKAVRDKNSDILFIRLPAIINNSRPIAEGIGFLDIPVILLPVNLDLIMLETDMAASLKFKGTNAMVANSEDHALDLIRIMATPRVLEGKKALIFGRPYDSTSVPAPNLNADYLYRRTGVKLEYRPIEELKERYMKVDESSARKEMARWKKDAAKIVEPSDEAILASSKLYVLLRSIVDQEGLSSISIDCLSYSFGPDRSIPTPCLAFTRLRDEGVSAPCEADVSMMLSSMLMQEISGRPSFVSNVSSVDMKRSTTVLRHCVAPLKISGPDDVQQPYTLRDYHGMGRGVSVEMEFPVGLDVTMGAFSKDLKDFVFCPGIVQQGVNDKATPSFKNAPPGMEKMRKFCSNRAEVKIKDAKRFLQNVAGIHHIMVAGNYSKEIYDAMLRMNVNVVAPPDLTV